MGNLKDEKIIEEERKMEKMEDLIDQYELKQLKRNEIIEGKVIKIGHSDVIVDIGYKQEGFIPIEECYNYKGEIPLKEGSFIKAVVKKISSREIVLSKKEADEILGWQKVERSFRTGEALLAPVVKKIRRGYLVNAGVELFLPDSQVDTKPVTNPNDIIGKEYRFKVIKLDERNKSGVVSRKTLLLEELKEQKDKLFSSIKVEDEVEATVTKIKKAGALVELKSSLTAFVPKSEISWGYLPDIRKKLKVGKTYKFKVLEVDKGRERIILSYKAFQEDPWKTAPKKYKIGTKIKGIIIGFKQGYAIVELEEGVNARLRGEDVYWGKRIKSLDVIFEIGDRVIGKVIDIIPEKRLIFIGIKQLEPSPWEKFLSQFKEGDIVEVKVKKLADSGVIVNIIPEIDGFIRKGDLDWGYVEHPSEVVKEGDTLKALILSIEEDTGRILLGVKQLEGDKWSEFFSKYKERDLVKTRVKKMLENFVVVELESGLEGIIRKGEIANKKFEEISEVLSVGDVKEALIKSIDRENRKIILSYKKAEREKMKKEMEQLRKVGTTDQKTTIGDLIKKEIMKKND